MTDIELKMLIRPLATVGLSTHFCEKSRVMGFKDLASILAVQPEDLFRRSDFSYIWFGELTRFLIEQDLLYLLQPSPGKSRA